MRYFLIWFSLPNGTGNAGLKQEKRLTKKQALQFLIKDMKREDISVSDVIEFRDLSEFNAYFGISI